MLIATNQMQAFIEQLDYDITDFEERKQILYNTIHITDEKEMTLDKRSSIISRATNILLPDIASRVRLAHEIIEVIKNTIKK